MSNELDAKAARERRNRKRKCVLCGVEESDKAPLGPHPDGIGPSCKDEGSCQQRRAAAGR